MGSLARIGRRVAAAVALLLIPGTAFVAGRTSLAGVQEASAGRTAAPAAVEWTVKQERIGRTLRLPGTLRLVDTPGPLVGVAGMLTTLPPAEGRSVRSGDVVAAVDLRPIVAGQGSVPAFRPLQVGAKGPDVAQLRRFLCAEQVLTACTADERFTPGVAAAVTRWQKALRVTPTGTVQPSDIMWLPQLPAVVRPAATAAVGNRVTADDRPVLTASGAPRLEVRLTAAQAALVPAGAPLSFEAVTGRVVGASPAPSTGVEGGEADQAMLLDVAGPDGRAPLCATTGPCTTLLGRSLTRTVEVAVDVVPTLTGTGVPARSVFTGADGATYVLRADGTRANVEVEATAGGLTIVDGLAVGDRILVNEQPRG
jgi:peptidoglycan hydrolase-like protein with peptidoglycan-binding domain